MSNLFSVFDPNLFFMGVPLNWGSAALCLIIFPAVLWVSSTQLALFYSFLFKFVHGEFHSIVGSKSLPGMTFIPLTLFIFIVLNNSCGLIPYMFTSSSHLTFTVSLAVPLWLGHMGYSMYKQPNFMLAHLVPLGTPGALMPFMVLIELVSNIIRPLTLSVRLAANMVAGHLLLTLLGSQGTNLSMAGVISVLLIGLLLLTMLELAVAVIQGYVFSILSMLYLSDVNSKKLTFIK